MDLITTNMLSNPCARRNLLQLILSSDYSQINYTLQCYILSAINVIGYYVPYIYLSVDITKAHDIIRQR